MNIHRHYRRKIFPKQRGGKWCVRVPDDMWFNGRVRYPQFDDKAAADRFAKQLMDERQKGAQSFLALRPAVQSQILAMVFKHGENGLIEAARWLDGVSQQSKIGFIQLGEDCIASKEKAGRLRTNTAAKMRVSIKSFEAHCSKPIHSISSEMVIAWLDAKGGSLESRKSRLGIISEVFAYALKNQIVSRNPCASIERPKIQPKQAVILTVEQIEELVRTAERIDKPLLGYLAPVIWGGLRDAESKRLKPENVGAEVINLHGEQTKTGRRSFQITPVLKAWLAVKGVKAGSGTLNNRRRMAAIEKESGVTIPRNALRKTCASMWFRLKGSREAAAPPSGNPLPTADCPMPTAG